MGKKLKLLALIMGLAVLLLAISVAVLPLFIDANQFKPQLASIVKKKTGWDVEFIGDLHWSIFPGLGISSGRVQLKNGPDFREAVFVSIDQGEVSIKALPLLQKRLDIDRIVLREMQVNLIRNQDGRENWRDFLKLGEAPKKNNVSPPAAPEQVATSSDGILGSLAVGALSLQNARIHWDDQQSGKQINLHEISLDSGYLTYDKPAKIDLTLSLDGNQPLLKGKIRLQTDLIIAQGFERLSMVNGRVNLTRESIDSAKAYGAVLMVPELKFETKAQQLDIENMELRSDDLSLVSSLRGAELIENTDIAGHVEIIESNPGRLMKNLGMTVPKFKDANAFSDLRADLDFRFNKHALDLNDLHGKLDDTSVQGGIRVDDFEKPSIHFELSLDQMNVDRYFPTALKNKKFLVSPGAALSVGLSKIPVDQLKKLAAQGEVGLKHLDFNGLSINDIRLRLTAGNGVVETHQTITSLYQGGYSGQVNIDARGPQALLSMRENVDHVNIETILQAMDSPIKMNGLLNVSTKLQGQGHDMKEIRRTLNGGLNFAVTEGEIKDLKFQEVLDKGLRFIEHAGPPDENQGGLPFSEISGTATLHDQVIQNSDLLIKSPRFQIFGNGKTEIESGKVDYRFVTKLVKAPATEAGPEKFHSTPIVISMTGTLDKPEYKLDMQALLTEKNKAKIEKLIDKNKDKIDRLRHKLEKKFGPGAADLLKKLF